MVMAYLTTHCSRNDVTNRHAYLTSVGVGTFKTLELFGLASFFFFYIVYTLLSIDKRNKITAQKTTSDTFFTLGPVFFVLLREVVHFLEVTNVL